MEYFEVKNSLRENSETAGINAESEAKIKTLAERLVKPTGVWVAPYPVISSKRIKSVCLALAATTPDEEEEVALVGVLLSLLLFALDDVADGVAGSYSDAEIEQILACYAHIAADGQNLSQIRQSYPDLPYSDDQAWWQVAQALARFSQELKNRPMAEPYYRFYARRFSLLMPSMVNENRWKLANLSSGNLPEFQVYLNNGQESIAFPTVMSGTLVAMGQPTNWQYADLEPLLEKFTLCAGATVRLANDLRSYQREALEGKPNSVSILMGQGQSEKTTIEELKALALDRLNQATAMIPALPAPLVNWGEAVLRSAKFSYYFYLANEFHSY